MVWLLRVVRLRVYVILMYLWLNVQMYRVNVWCESYTKGGYFV